MNEYFKKWGIITNGIENEAPPPGKPIKSIFISGVISFIGIFIVSTIEYHTDFLLIVASFAASAVLIYDCIDSPLAQPRNVLGGHLLSSLIGVGCYKIFSLHNGIYFYSPIVSSLSVSLSIIGMDLTKTTHPPGAATALIAVIGPPNILEQGFFYVLHPIASGAAIMLLVAIVFNNLVPDRRYPKYWL